MHSHNVPLSLPIIFAILSSLILSNCSPKLYQCYTGSPRPYNDIARVLPTTYVSTINEIDGQASNASTNFWTGPPKLQFLPGNHTLTLVFPTGEQTTISFDIQGGHSYKLDRWGNDAVLIREEDSAFVAPTPGANDVIVRSPEPDFLKHSGVGLLSIDSKTVHSICRGFALRLAPGLHTFTFSYFDIQGLFKPNVEGFPQTISANLESGYTYVVEPQVDLKKMIWHPKLVRTNR